LTGSTPNFVALTRKLLIALWQMVTTGEIPEGVELHRHDYRITPGSHHYSGKSMADTYLLAMRCPVCRRRHSHSGFRTELENLSGDAKRKGTSGDPARRKVAMRRNRGGPPRSSVEASVMLGERSEQPTRLRV